MPIDEGTPTALSGTSVVTNFDLGPDGSRTVYQSDTSWHNLISAVDDGVASSALQHFAADAEPDSRTAGTTASRQADRGGQHTVISAS